MSVRRKGPKDLPKLPLSLFTPPNTSTGDSFDLPPSPGTLHPAKIIDAHIATSDAKYSQWKQEVGGIIADRTVGVVISLPSALDLDRALNESKSVTNSKVISFIIPFDLEKPDKALDGILSSAVVPVSLSTIFTGNTTAAVEGLRWAFKTGRPVDIDVHATLSDSVLESFVDLIGKATVDLEHTPPIVLSNILPPPHVLDIPIVRLMTHPTYSDFQSQIATLSLVSQLNVKFLPPDWDAPTPQTPFPGSPIEANDTQQLNEWKRRIKMYLAPVIEAFGSERIIYGSSTSSSARTPAKAGDWYEIARESLVETGVDLALIENIFYANADRVYGKK